MGEIRDMMGTFELYQPMELGGALELLRSHGSDAWILVWGSGHLRLAEGPSEESEPWW